MEGEEFRGFAYDALKASSSVVIVLDADGLVVDWNTAAENVYGYSKEDIFGKNYIELCLPENARDAVKADVQKVLGGHITSQFENPVLAKNGSTKILSWTVSRYMDALGSPAGVLAIGVDVTEVKHYQQLLENRINLEQALSDVSTLLARVSDEDLIPKVLDILLAASSVDKILFYKNIIDDKGLQAQFACEKLNQGISTTNLTHLGKIAYDPHFTDIKEQLKASDAVPIVLHSCTDQQREMMMTHGVQSLLIVPIFVGNHWHGVLAFVCTKHERVWANEDIEILHTVGEVVGGHLQRGRDQGKLIHSEERLSLALQGSNEGIWDWGDLHKDAMYWSPRFYELLGYKQGEIAPSVIVFDDLIHQDDKDLMRTQRKRHLQNHMPFDIEIRLRVKSDVYRWFHMRGQAVWNTHGQATRMVGSLTDIHERKNAQADLEEQREFLSKVIENMPVGVFAKNVQDNYSFTIWNQFMEDLFGLSRTDAIGKTDYDFFDKDVADAFRELDEGVVDGRQTVDIEQEKIAAKDGERFAHTIKVPIYDKNNKPLLLLGILEDITEKVKSTELLQQKVADLEAFKKVTVHREIRMYEFKQQNKELQAKLEALKQHIGAARGLKQ